MKITDKTKKYLTIGGGILICAGLATAISLQFSTPSVGGDQVTKESSEAGRIVMQSNEVTKETLESTEETTGETIEETKVVIQPSIEPSTVATDAIQPADSRPAQTDQPNQSIQPEVTKPAEPEDTVKTNPEQKPDGTKVETPPIPVEHELVEKPVEIPSVEDEPQGGDTQDGKTYFPGFGWVEGTGDTHGTIAEDMYENGNKIGEMGE